jgi:hypothetical protein
MQAIDRAQGPEFVEPPHRGYAVGQGGKYAHSLSDCVFPGVLLKQGAG